jgi:hypothetical protein
MFIRKNGLLIEVETEVDEIELNELELERDWNKRLVVSQQKIVTPIKASRSKGEKMLTLEKWVLQGVYTRKQLIEMYLKAFGGSKLTPMTSLSDGKNPRYNKFSKLVKENPISHILSF